MKINLLQYPLKLSIRRHLTHKASHSGTNHTAVKSTEEQILIDPLAASG